jgi:hypothetical protein
MVLYDNAGEHFMPGASPANFASSTRHLERSRCIVMVFDPLQDQRFKARFAPGYAAPRTPWHERQELIFTEAVARIRRLRSLSPSEPISVPIVVALTKADVWANGALGDNWWQLPPVAEQADLQASLRETSNRLRAVMRETAPEFAAAVAALAKEVWFVPASALGTSPLRDASGRYHIPPSAIQPRWAEMPFVLSLLLADEARQQATA